MSFGILVNETSGYFVTKIYLGEDKNSKIKA